MLHTPALQAAEPAVASRRVPDGLQLSRTLPYGAVYVKPGATFGQYKGVALLDCFVQFAKDWAARLQPERAGPRDAGVAGRRGPHQERNSLPSSSSVFTAELQTDGDYPDRGHRGSPSVLILRPAILNLDRQRAGDRHGAANVGLRGRIRRADDALPRAVGATTNTLLARVIDTEADQGQGGLAQAGNSVKNKEAADRILKNWADRMRKALDTARAAAPGPAAPTPVPAPAPTP